MSEGAVGVKREGVEILGWRLREVVEGEVRGLGIIVK